MIRAVAFDMDDTLLTGERTITPFTLSVLRRAAERGVRIVPASGRARDSMFPYVKEIGCASAFVACNGAEVYTAEGELERGILLTVEQARACARFAAENDCYAQCYYGAHFYYNREGHWATAYAESSMLTGFCVNDLETFIDRPTPKVLLMAEGEKIARLLPVARERFAGIAAVSCSKPWFLEFNPALATKGNALRYLAEKWDIPAEDFAAYGDSLNDVAMLDFAGRGVAMENAREDVKARVRFTCGSNESDGVARDILKYVLHEEA